MKKFMKWACMASLIIGLLVSCAEEITSNSLVLVTNQGCTNELENFVIQQANEYSLSQTALLHKETAIQQFDNFVNNLQDEIEAKKYLIFGNTSITLSLQWSNEIVKETKLDLEQNTPTTVVLTANVTIEHQTGDSTAFIDEYGKKLQAAGLLTDDNSYYLYYGEFKTYQDAKKQLDNMNQEGILNITKLYNYFKSLTGFAYTGKVSINYLLMDGNEAPKGSANTLNAHDSVKAFTHTSYENYDSYTGWYNVDIKE